MTDKDLATVARMALQGIPGSKVDEALRAALHHPYSLLLSFFTLATAERRQKLLYHFRFGSWHECAGLSTEPGRYLFVWKPFQIPENDHLSIIFGQPF